MKKKLGKSVVLLLACNCAGAGVKMTLVIWTITMLMVYVDR